jgi:ribosomal protein S18 acetylase RimI-like enzyme
VSTFVDRLNEARADRGLSPIAIGIGTPAATSRVIRYCTLLSTIDSDQPTGANIIALDGDQLVASLGLRLREPGGYVNSLFVAPTHQGQGIGRQLLEEAARVSQEHQKPTLGLAVHDNNLVAQKLYKRLGFRPYDTLSEGYTQYVAMLPLTAQPAT